jgi:flagellar hook protein FlgE
MGYKDLGTASGSATYFGNALTMQTQIVGSALEQSTTDMAAQLTNLTVYQRAYQANSKALITNDQMEQTLFQLVT